jgi:hypothetical protein
VLYVIDGWTRNPSASRLVEKLADSLAGPIPLAAGDIKIVWEVEVSRRGVPPPEFIETKAFETPIAYRIPQDVLKRKRPVITAKIELIDFRMAAAELLPYIAPEIRQSIDETRWDEIRLDVAHHVERWMDSAIARAKPSGDNYVQNADSDLAGR